MQHDPITGRWLKDTAEPAEVRFWRFVEKTEGCWLWRGAINNRGYGTFGPDFYAKKRTVFAHRWAYEQIKGVIPDGLVVDHLCKTTNCVNPSHLEPVTQAENMARERRSQCIHGHLLSPSNIYVHDGQRYCRTCRRDRVRSRMAKEAPEQRIRRLAYQASYRAAHPDRKH